MIRRVHGPAVHLVGASLARILVGFAALHFYLSNYAHRAFLLGPHAYNAGLHPRGPTLYSIAPVDVVYHLGIAAALAFTLFGGRPLAAAHAVVFWSTYARNVDIFDGGDNFGRIAAIILIAAITNAYLAPGAPRRRERLRTEHDTWSTFAHNGAVVLLGVQILIVYLSAGLQKETGVPWRAGTALHQISQLHDYRFMHWTPLLAIPVVVFALTNAVVLLEVGFPIAMWTPARVPWVIGCGLMHVGIAATMGLVGFALNMWAGLAICLTDDDYARLARFTRAGFRRPSRRRDRERQRPRRIPEPATPEPLR